MEINFGSINKKNRASQRSLISNITKKIEKLVPTDSDDDIQIMVTEVQCFDPDCVPLETLVILLGKSARWSQKILKPMIEVTDDDLSDLLMPTSWSDYVNEGGAANSKREDTDVVEEQDLVTQDDDDWAASLVRTIEGRKSMVKPAQFQEELSIIMQCIHKMQQLLPTPTPCPPAAAITEVTMVPMRAKITPTQVSITHTICASHTHTVSVSSGANSD